MGVSWREREVLLDAHHEPTSMPISRITTLMHIITDPISLSSGFQWDLQAR